MTEQDELVDARWRTSSYSASSGDCVQVARDSTGAGAVRDSKNIAGGVLRAGPEAMNGLMACAGNGDLRAP